MANGSSSKSTPTLESLQFKLTICRKVGQEIVFPSTGYLAMAIEAATQAVEVNGGFEEEISSYEIQDVSLQKALVIPEEDGGIEILFTLRKASLNTNSDYESRFEFLLTSVDSVNGEDNFVENCRGTVHVNFKPDGKSSI